MKNITINRKTITLVLLTVCLICGIQSASPGFFGDIIDAIGDVAGGVGGAVGDVAGALGEVGGIVVDVVVDTVKIAAEVVGLSVRIVATVVWHTDSLESIELFPNGGLIGVVVSNLIHLWDPSTGRTTVTLTHDAAIRDIAISPDGMFLASASEDSTVQLWNPNTGLLQHIFHGHTNSVLSIAFSPDGMLLASGSADDTIRLWDPELGTLQATLVGHTDDVLSIAFSPDGLLLASASADGAVRLWDPELGTLQATLAGHTDSVLDVVFSPDGLLLASASADGTVRLWDPNTRTIQVTLDHKSPVLSIAFSPDGEGLASGSSDGTARLWAPDMAKVIATLGHGSPVRSVAFSPDGSMLFSTTEDGKMRQWEITTDTETSTTDEPSVSAEDTQIGITPGDNDTSLVIRLSDFRSTFFPGSLAYGIQWRRKASQKDWEEKCVEVEQDEFVLDNLNPGTTYQVRYEFLGFTCTFYSFLKSSTNDDGWSPIAEGTTSGASNTNETAIHPSESTPATSEGTTVQIHPASVVIPTIGQLLEFSLNITSGEAVAGYQATVRFDTSTLGYVSGANGDYLPAGAFFVEPKVEGNLVKLNAASAGESSGDGTLATLTFEVIAVKASTLTLSDVLLVSSVGETFTPKVRGAQITESTQLTGDVNGDGIVNIQDLVSVSSNIGQTGRNVADVNGDNVVNIVDLVLVAGALGDVAAAPLLRLQSLEMLTAAEVRLWLTQARQLDLTDPTAYSGVLFLEKLRAVLIPKETTLLANFPNPFNPETWIPYRLSKPTDVTIIIYAVNGQVVRRLALGHQPAGVYENRSRAAYWDGRNAFGESVASDVYFYTLTAGDFTATRKMLIRK